MLARHCEERSDAAIQEHRLNCFATLAMTKSIIPAIALCCVAACRDQAPPTPTAEESARLNEMDNSLNALAKNEGGPEANASDPSNSSN